MSQDRAIVPWSVIGYARTQGPFTIVRPIWSEPGTKVERGELHILDCPEDIRGHVEVHLNSFNAVNNVISIEYDPDPDADTGDAWRKNLATRLTTFWVLPTRPTDWERLRAEDE